MADNIQLTAKTPDGRTLAIEEAGDPHGRPVLVHAGTPNSRHIYGPNAGDAASRGLRLIGYDRPGYGGSFTPNAGGARPGNSWRGSGGGQPKPR
jgi:pimeloyl-ACP methyl ester carboxylesterase